MTASTLLPPAGGISPELERATAGEAVAHARLVGPDGTEITLPAEVYNALRELVQLMSRGQAVTISVSDSTMTTQEAADFLGISRPTLIKLLDAGEIPFIRPGTHRRLQVQDVAAYRETRRSNRLKGLQELVEVSQSMGLYDDADEAPIRR